MLNKGLGELVSFTSMRDSKEFYHERCYSSWLLIVVRCIVAWRSKCTTRLRHKRHTNNYHNSEQRIHFH